MELAVREVSSREAAWGDPRWEEEAVVVVEGTLVVMVEEMELFLLDSETGGRVGRSCESFGVVEVISPEDGAEVVTSWEEVVVVVVVGVVVVVVVVVVGVLGDAFRGKGGREGNNGKNFRPEDVVAEGVVVVVVVVGDEALRTEERVGKRGISFLLEMEEEEVEESMEDGEEKEESSEEAAGDE